MVGGQPNPRAQHQQSIPSTGREACLPGARCLSRCLSTAPKATTLSVPPIPRAQHHRSIPSTGREAYPPGARCLSTAPKMTATVGALSTQSTPTVHPYESIPNTGRNTWLNFYRLWRTNGFQYFHQVMERNFRTYGPIYRENIGTHHSVNIMHPRDVAELFQSEGIFPRRMRVEAWAAHRQLRNHKCGVFLL
ncbi:hypothetical protein NDU88_004638 [Pleurodeles waltl]|uniref:Cholesterol desmolase n=1 Tax=Pleurodeles waltl TaxID=8319 RepID=A0AAV7V2A3_PLEWA|nr:hypothetical protein NDU88_004638 [Pleurodeles waltl]